jgi:hypothetical protein
MRLDHRLLCLVFAASCSGSESEQYQRTVSVGQTDVPQVQAFIEGMPVTMQAYYITETFDSFEEGTSAPSIEISLYEDGVLMDTEMISAGDCVRFCRDVGTPLRESFSFPIHGHSTAVYFGEPTANCEGVNGDAYTCTP